MTEPHDWKEAKCHGVWPTLSWGSDQQHLCWGPIHHYMATWQSSTQFSHCLWNTINQYSTAKKTFSALSTLLGREEPPYLVSRYGKPALVIWWEVAIHPSKTLFLIMSAQETVQAGMKHTELSYWSTGLRAG